MGGYNKKDGVEKIGITAMCVLLEYRKGINGRKV